MAHGGCGLTTGGGWICKNAPHSGGYGGRLATARGSGCHPWREAEATLAASQQRVDQRAHWNAELEKSLVEILLENKDHRGDNGWSSDEWNKMVKEFHKRNTYARYSKNKIQDKEGQLKRDYRMLKEARAQSGSSWNEKRCMVEAPPFLWDNLEVTFPKIKKFRNGKLSFPLFELCGELYDGQLADGKYNLTSLEPAEEAPLRQIIDADEELDDIMVLDEDDGEGGRDEGEAAAARGRDEGATAAERRALKLASSELKDSKKPKKNNVENMMERYLEMRTKQAEDEYANLAKEKEKTDDFSIKKCISVLRTMGVTKEEKVKAFAVFKTQENREIFLCAAEDEDDPEAALDWLRSEMT